MSELTRQIQESCNQKCDSPIDRVKKVALVIGRAARKSLKVQGIDAARVLGAMHARETIRVNRTKQSVGRGIGNQMRALVIAPDARSENLL